MDLAKRDNLINQLKTQKKEKEQFLTNKRNLLSKQKADNPHLGLVLDGYNDYFSQVDQEQKKQHTALQVLADYMAQIILDPTSTKELIKQAKYDQGVILAELRKFKM